MRFFSTGVWLRRLRCALLILAFVCAFLYIFSLNFRTPNKMDFLQRFVTETISPPMQFAGKVFSGFEEFFKDYIWLRNLRAENESLKRQIAELQSKVTSYQEAYIENQRLRRLLDFKKSTKDQTIAAQVVVHDLTGWFQTLMVDKGFRDGVAADMPVVNEEGVIGRVLDVSDHYSRVLLITDQRSAVDAIDERNRVRGILCGKDVNGCLLKFVSSNLDVEEGDLVITSGKDGIYPKGLRLGVVHAVYKDPSSLFQRIEVTPLVRLNRLEEVLIIKKSKIGMGVEGGNPPDAATPEGESQTDTEPVAHAQASQTIKHATKPSVKFPLKLRKTNLESGRKGKPKLHHGWREKFRAELRGEAKLKPKAERP